MESTIDYLQRHLREVGPSGWPDIVEKANKGLFGDDRITVISLRKIAYGERRNIGSLRADALRAYFAKREKARA